MPLVTTAYLSFAGGLLAGFAAAGPAGLGLTAWGGALVLLLGPVLAALRLLRLRRDWRTEKDAKEHEVLPTVRQA